MESVKRAIEKGDRSAMAELWQIAIREDNSEAVDLIEDFDFQGARRWREKNQLLDDAHHVIKYNDKEAAYSILQLAKEKGTLRSLSS